MKYHLLCLVLFSSGVFAQNSIKVSTNAWQGLSSEDKNEIQKKYLVETIDSEYFGVIIDNQGIDKSTPGTKGGSVLGEAVANAAYIDNALDGGDYSAKNHLGVLLVGALVGGMFDSKPQSHYKFRYAIRLGNGSIIYKDIFSTEPFRHPVGVCVRIPEVSVVAEQHLCTQTSASLRDLYIQKENNSIDFKKNVEFEKNISSKKAKEDLSVVESKKSVYCKINTLAPVNTSLEKCNLINGVVIND